jgi:hypothetical protein
MACSCCEAHHEPYIRSAIPRATVLVTHGRSSSTVRLAALRVQRADGRRRVSLADVWWAAGLPADPAPLRIDLVGDDGFETASKDGEPLRGSVLERAFVDVETRDVSWAIPVPCYYRIKGLACVVARPFVAVTRARNRAAFSTGSRG